MTKVQKSKIWDDRFVGFSLAVIMVYFVFSVGTAFLEKFINQNCQFWKFSKNSKKGDFVRQNLHHRKQQCFLGGGAPCCSIFRWLRRGILHFCWGPNKNGAMTRSPPTSNHNFCAVFSNSRAVLSNSCGLKQFTVHSKSSKYTPSFFSSAVFKVLYWWVMVSKSFIVFHIFEKIPIGVSMIKKRLMQNSERVVSKFN